MPQPIIFTITEAGKQAALNANADSAQLKINLTQVAVGTAQHLATGNETALTSEVKRGSIVSGDIEVVSNTLRFTTSMSGDTKTDVYEVGLFTDDGVLFALAGSNTTPLFSLHPDITFVIALGLSLDDIDASNITVTTDTNGALSIVMMENHLAAPDPHPQYLNNARFNLLLQALIPMGYIHHTHSTANPKPLFDELMGIDTAWRRLTGKIIVATDPNEAAIKDHSVVLGQRGMTDDATSQRPHVYPLQTTHVFERYNPSDAIETVWNVKANKTSITEGGVVRFTVTANNLPDGQILNWSVKEGALNGSNNDITSPDKTDSGTVILRNGQAVIDFTTTPDDNVAEPQKHVRLTVGAPANLSINVPVNDAGHNETALHITQSTTNGIDLAEYYKQQSGSYPTATDKIRFIVDAGVDIIAPNTSTPAMIEGGNWTSGAEIVVENRGRILGRGGDGGSSARYSELDNPVEPSESSSNQSMYDIITPAESGSSGGLAIKSLSSAILVENHSVVAGGGGGGGGGGLYHCRSANGLGVMVDGVKEIMFVGGGGGSGGGAPLGHRHANLRTLDEFYENFNPNNVELPHPPPPAYIKFIKIRSDADSIAYISGGSDAQKEFMPNIVAADNNESTFYQVYWVDGKKDYYYRQHDKTDEVMLQSQNATIDKSGSYGYAYAMHSGKLSTGAYGGGTPYTPSEIMAQNHGGGGGGWGEKAI